VRDVQERAQPADESRRAGRRAGAVADRHRRGHPDVSWLYDVDFDALESVDVVTGEKAYQLALALEHAGVRIGAVEPDMEKAVAMMRAFEPTAAGRQTWFVNYELMMIGRRILGHGDQEVARR